jgi:hypothetical protein
MENRWLPIGSIVKLGGVKVVVAGYQAVQKGRYYKYIGFVYPIGLYSKDEIILFNQEKIKEVLFEGYKFEHFDDVMNSLEENYKKIMEEQGL